MDYFSTLKQCLLWGIFTVISSSLVAAPRLTVPATVREIAQRHEIPPMILYAVALNESAAWPWSLNVAGKSYRYETRVQACQAFKHFAQRYPLKRIDIGIAQVNAGWNGTRFFKQHCDGFEPYANFHAAALILKECYAIHHSWISAAGCYHHPAGGKPTQHYMAGIRQQLKRIQGVDNSPSGKTDQINIALQSLLSTTPLATRKAQTTSLPSAPVLAMRKPTSPLLRWVMPSEQRIVWINPINQL